MLNGKWPILLLLFLTGCAAAEPTRRQADNPPTPVPSMRIDEIIRNVADARAAYYRLPFTDPNVLTPEQRRAWRAFTDQRDAGYREALSIFQADPTSDAGFTAMQWLLMDRNCYDQDAGVAAIGLAAEYQSKNPRIGPAIAFLAHVPPEFVQEPTYFPTIELLNKVARENPDKTTRGQALLGMANLLKWDFDWAAAHGQPEQGGLKLAALDAYKKIREEYGSCPNLYDRNGVETATLGEKADRVISDLEHLGVGNTAPDIHGRDLDNAAFNLSDYRGKVVLLIFWSSWCGPCMADVPHENQVAERYSNSPFVIIGVNGDGEAKTATETAAKRGMLWRSFFDNASRPTISDNWDIRGWPTTYLIDPAGVIRYKDVRGEALDIALVKMLGKAPVTQPVR